MGDRVNRGHFELAHIDGCFSCSSASLPSLLAGLLIGGQVERDKKEQVGANDAASGDGSEFFAGTPTVIRHPWEVGRDEVGIGGKVHEP